ncbi:tetratricopeptide repeat protein 37 [Diorhabda sublineata]|uniref:tetratricopeptide repeat protein 37 n=1 Tax=Diorhabda sublineata TaxID=1163346 RepID=UPI0024E099CD|nr:tetratricopeptide repeat protein 37 [Diorhabda sublineata]
MKDVKALLKQAREAIKNKNYDLSLKLSKTILKEDRSNYMALVFLGLTLQEIGPVDQACKAFQKAIDNNPTNPLAWNGLINYYEKLETDEAKNKLEDTYISALEFETNPKKIVEYCEKLSKLYTQENIVKITECIYKCLAKNESGDILEVLVKLYQSVGNVPKELLSIFEECFRKILDKREFKRVEYYSSYLNLLYKQNKYEEVFKNAENMHKCFDSDTVSLTWMCKVYNQLYTEDFELSDIFTTNIDDYYIKLLNKEPDNGIGLFTKGIRTFLMDKLRESKDILKEVCVLRPRLVHAWVFLTKINVMLNLNEDALESFLTANKLLNSNNYSNPCLTKIITSLHLSILSKSTLESDWERANDIYNSINDEKVKLDSLEDIITVNINLNNISEAESQIAFLKTKNDLKASYLEAKLLKKQQRYEAALQILENNTPDNSDWWMEIGKIYWSIGSYKKSLVPFLKAAKCNPNNYSVFYNLGNYYQKFEDFEKARRCYEKAFHLNTNSQKIATELSKMYCKLKNWETAHNLLENISNGTINEKTAWAWLQLGLSYLEQENYTKAIEKLQFVVRIDKENTYNWQCLADAYYSRGSYTSALKCYTKSLDYTENILYPSLQIANIKKTLGLYDEAKADFLDIILKNEQYLPALKGLAETCIYQAKECYRDQRLGSAQTHAQKALNYLSTALGHKNNFSCLWKLIADVFLFVSDLPEQYCSLKVTEDLMEGKSVIDKEEMFVLATSCYCKAIGLMEDILLWHDLSNCYLKHALSVNDREKRDTLLSYATQSAQHCVSSNPKYWQHWNLLGIIAMEQIPPNYALAQHYFIKAVTVENNNPIAWSNLGVLYFIMGDVKLANKAFAQGQRSDPNYVNNWIGQALIAETMGVDEAMDLFRHSVQLGHHQEGAIGYGHWVCQTLLEAPQKTISYSIEDMHAIPVACDAITWYTEKNSKDGCAWNMLGMLKERMKLYLGSLESFKKSYELSPDTRDLARINYGRLLSKHEKYLQAINIYQEVQEATFSSGSGLALALFKSQHYEESYSAYEQALHWLTEEQSHQSELLVALASMAYMFQGLEGAKTLLFQSIQLKPPSPWGLYATFSLGLLHKDFELAELVLKELETLKDDEKSLPHYALLLCSKLIRQEQPDRAVKELSKLVHRHPDDASVWLNLAVTILRVKSEHKRALAAVKCAQTALKIGRSSMDVTKVSAYISLGYLLTGDVKNVLVSAQKSIHCYPTMADGWAALLASLTQNKESYSLDFISGIFNYMESLNMSELLANWLKKLKKNMDL